MGGLDEFFLRKEIEKEVHNIKIEIENCEHLIEKLQLENENQRKLISIQQAEVYAANKLIHKLASLLISSDCISEKDFNIAYNSFRAELEKDKHYKGLRGEEIPKAPKPKSNNMYRKLLSTEKD